MSEETVPVLSSASDAQSPTDNVNLQDMFSQFLKTSEENQLRHQVELTAIKAVVDRLSETRLSKVPRIMKHLRIAAKPIEGPLPSLAVHHLSTKLMLPHDSGYHQQLLILHSLPVLQFQQLLRSSKFCKQRLYMKTS